MRRFFTLIFSLALGLPLIAAAPGTTFLPPPVVVVFPLTVNGNDVQKESGSRIAIIIAQSMANLGGVVVKPAPPGSERKDYLAITRAQSADYYLSGYVTPLGEGASVVEQLVSAQSGIVVYSGTAQIKSYADADGQGAIIREAMLRHQARNIGAYEAPPERVATAAPTVAPAADGGQQANIGKLFGRKKATPKPVAAATAIPAATSTNGPAAPPRTVASVATPAPNTPAPKAKPTPARPAEPTAKPVAVVTEAPHQVALAGADSFGVLAIGGTADSERREFARNAIESSIAAVKGKTSAFAVTPAELGSRGNELCKSAEVETILGGNLVARTETTFGQSQTTASFELIAYDCTGHVKYHKSFERDAGGDWKFAVERAVSAAVGAYLHPVKRAR